MCWPFHSLRIREEYSDLRSFVAVESVWMDYSVKEKKEWDILQNGLSRGEKLARRVLRRFKEFRKHSTQEEGRFDGKKG